MRKLDINTVLFVVGVIVAANALIALAMNVVIENSLVADFAIGALAVLGIYVASMTWRSALRFLMQPQDGRGRDS